MRILINDRWTDGFLDYHRRPEDYLLEIVIWKNLERLEGVYYERPKSPWIIWNYLWDIGPRQTIRKAVSRAQERYRNEKYVACGIGYIRERPKRSALSLGQAVVFLAPCHPRLAERIVLPEELVKPLDLSEISFLPERGVLCCTELENGSIAGRWWHLIRAWNPYSGSGISRLKSEGLLDQALNALKNTDWKRAVNLESTGRRSSQSREAAARQPGDRRKTAVLFGYGNYAKNIILPNVRRYLDVRCIHELDPLQIPLKRMTRYGYRWDTGGEIDGDEKYDVYLIAGFHHTHAPLAIAGLRQGATVLVEKPIAVTKAQLDATLEALSGSSGKLFCCFHKRFSSFNSWAREDLQLRPGEPISYHCIVYEAPLPPYHWYRWPNSGSRLITNGCHWIDHFLFLNGCSEATACSLSVAPDRSAINCSVTLANGAFFTMVMTYSGSERIGPQDYVELRANGRTARIVNESEYLAEAGHRILRKQKVNKMHSYSQMYQEISGNIAEGVGGDSIPSIRGAVDLGLWLEECDERLRDLNPKFKNAGLGEYSTSTA